jgi:hypothetical protein
MRAGRINETGLIARSGEAVVGYRIELMPVGEGPPRPFPPAREQVYAPESSTAGVRA